MEKINFIPLLSKTPTRIKVSGSSMKPLLMENDQVIVVSADKKDIIPGDIVVFRREGKDYVHRVVFVNNDSFYEIGDNQRVGNWESFKQPLAKVVCIEKKDGKKIDLSTKSEKKIAKKIVFYQKLKYKQVETKKNINIKIFSFLTLRFLRLLELFFKPRGFFEEKN